jgi:hypothetical protein
MRNRIRIQPYVSREVRRKLGAYARNEGVTESGVVESALSEFLERDNAEAALVVRRLDAFGRTMEALRGDLDVATHAIAVLARFVFFVVPPEPPADAIRRLDKLYGVFIAMLSRRVRAGSSLAVEVRRAGEAAVAAPTSAAKDGQ